MVLPIIYVCCFEICFLENQSKFSVMIIKSSCETINKFIKFLYYKSDSVNLYYDGFSYTHNFGDNLLDLLANCDEIKKVDYSKFIVYLLLRKFCSSKKIYSMLVAIFSNRKLVVIPPTRVPPEMFLNGVEYNYFGNLILTFMYYKKCIDVSNIIQVGTQNLDIRSSRYMIIENNLMTHICLSIIVKQEYEYRSLEALVNNIACYLYLLF